MLCGKVSVEEKKGENCKCGRTECVILMSLTELFPGIDVWLALREECL